MSRRATVVLRDGKTYVADAITFSGRRLTMTARLRVRNRSGERYYPTKELMVPLGRVKAILWHKEEGHAR
ncbi:MAG: hypothetical protein WAU69_03020 [Solirubrobacteraceae bacterium]